MAVPEASNSSQLEAIDLFWLSQVALGKLLLKIQEMAEKFATLLI